MLNKVATDLAYKSHGWPKDTQLAFALARPGIHRWYVHFAAEQSPEVDLDVVIRPISAPILIGTYEYQMDTTVIFADGSVKTLKGVFNSRTGIATFR